MKQIFLLSFLIFCFGISANVSGSGLVSAMAHPIPSDTLDVELVATRGIQDSSIHIWTDELHKEIYHLTSWHGDWRLSHTINETFNDRGLLIEDIRTNINNCCTPDIKTVYEYDNNKRITLKSSQVFENEQWINNKKEMYEYDGKSREVFYSIEIWDDNQWLLEQKRELIYDGDNLIFIETYNIAFSPDLHRTENEFDDNNNIILSTKYLFSSSNNDWILAQIINFTYNEYNQLINEFKDYQLYNISDLLYSYNYDSLGNNIMTEIESIQETTIRRHLYQYDQNGNIIESLSQELEDDVWINTHKTNFIIDNLGNQLLRSYSTWEENFWNNYDQLIRIFDSNGNLLIRENLRKWNSDDWSSGQRFQYIYLDEVDADGNSLTNTKSIENFSLEEGWQTFFHLKYYYEEIQEKNYDFIESQIGLFPNPASETFSIKLEIPFVSGMTVDIYATNGQLVYSEQLPLRNIHEINIAELPKGIYIVKLTDGEQQLSDLLFIK